MKCAWLENMISVETDGWTRPCCLETSNHARVFPISQGILKSFNHKKIITLREDLKDGFSEKTRHACYRCENLEIKNQQSMRITTPFLSEKRELKGIQFKMSNKCQLTCAHCGPDRSSGWAKLLNITPHVKKSFEVTDEFLSELEQLLPQLEVIKFTGGEPFLDPDHWKILEFLDSKDKSHCELQYITNGISPFRSELWKGWKEVNCSISVDGFEKSYEWFRRGSDWRQLLDNTAELEKHSTISINYSVTPYTIFDFLKARDFWSKKYTFGYFPIIYPEHCNMLKFPRSYIEKLPNYKNIPYTDCCSDDGDINQFRRWAINSDIQWGTLGQSEKLFWWMK